MTPPILNGWEVSTNRVDMFENLMNNLPIGDPIITSNTACSLSHSHTFLQSFLIISQNGFAWRVLTIGVGVVPTLVMDSVREANGKKNKWVRWHDVADLIPRKLGHIRVVIKKRKEGALILDKKGNYKTKEWKLAITKLEGEKNGNRF